MASDSFAEILNKLKETHDREVQGLQTKLSELTNEKCRDSQRIEELFTKNHHLREQQKALKENVKVLENRLRAGLCDRCQVTQELAKKKLHEFRKAHFQSLQHIFILTNEMHKLREENKSLKEERKRLCCPEGRLKAFKGQSREGNSSLDLPFSLLSTWGRKSSAEKILGQEAEDEYCKPLERDLSSEQRPSPDSRVSPNLILQGEHALDMSSQKTANHLHGTIVMARASSQEREGPGDDPQSLARKAPESSLCGQNPSLEMVGKVCKRERSTSEASTDDPGEKLLQFNRENLEQEEETMEVPLDLSDYGRGKEIATNWHQPYVKCEAQSPGGDPNKDFAVQKTCLSHWLSMAHKHLHGSKEQEQFATKVEENMKDSLIPLPRELSWSEPSSHDPGADTEAKVPFAMENEDVRQPDDGDSNSLKDDSDDPDVSENEMTGAYEGKGVRGASVKEYCCSSENLKSFQKKRKRGEDSWTKGYQKAIQGRQNDKATPVSSTAQEAMKEMANHSPAFRHNDLEET